MAERDYPPPSPHHGQAGHPRYHHANPTPDFRRAYPRGFFDWLNGDECFARHSRRMRLFRKFHDLFRETRPSREEASSSPLPLHRLPRYRPAPETLYAADRNGPAEWALLIPLEVISAHASSRN